MTTPTNTALTLGQAARVAGVGKTTLARAIKSGRMSASRTDEGSYRIEPAELHRVYPIPAVAQDGDATGEMVHHATPATVTDAMVALLRGQLADLRQDRDDLRQDRDSWKRQAEKWQQQAEAVGRLLTDQRQGRPAPQAEQQLTMSLEQGDQAKRLTTLLPRCPQRQADQADLAAEAAEAAEAAMALVRRPWWKRLVG